MLDRIKDRVKSLFVFQREFIVREIECLYLVKCCINATFKTECQVCLLCIESL